MSTTGKERLTTILIAPHVSEKSARLGADGNQYVFRVRTDATRPEIRAAVQYMFEVKVDSVRVLNLPGKRKRFGRALGQRQAWKKAYVRLAAGQTIELAGAERA
ncbi:MAG: 50S ribosomal protein L23 [Gammaproteobacteria bacterium]|jgi:large subunit ribosomal protein L23|nr:MAG: 50S ribosomal protein L23 [Gammaproteobacteria bacterium]